jgi:hypothetical protein
VTFVTRWHPGLDRICRDGARQHDDVTSMRPGFELRDSSGREEESQQSGDGRYEGRCYRGRVPAGSSIFRPYGFFSTYVSDAGDSCVDRYVGRFFVNDKAEGKGISRVKEQRFDADRVLSDLRLHFVSERRGIGLDYLGGQYLCTLSNADTNGPGEVRLLYRHVS